jgi:hypothetical protein
MKNLKPIISRMLLGCVLVLSLISDLHAQTAVPAPIPNPVGIPNPALMSTNLTGYPIASGPVEVPASNPSNLPLFTNFPVYTGQPIQFDGAIHAPIPSPDNTPLPEPTVIYEGNDIGWITMVLSESSTTKSSIHTASLLSDEEDQPLIPNPNDLTVAFDQPLSSYSPPPIFDTGGTPPTSPATSTNFAGLGDNNAS